MYNNKQYEVSKLPLIKHNGEIVMTTELVAKYFGCDVNNIQKNFSVNKKRFEEGKHYVTLTGAHLKDYLEQHVKNCDYVSVSRKNISKIRNLTLWTKRGVGLLAKMSETDKAWEIIGTLVDFYFDREETKRFAIPSNMGEALEIAIGLYKENEQLKAKIEEDAPKVEMYDTMAEAEVETSLASMAQLLRNIDIQVGRTRLVKLFRVWGWYKVGTTTPIQKYVENGYFVLKQVYVPGINKVVDVGKLTWKGEQAVVNKIKKTSDDILESVGAKRIK